MSTSPLREGEVVWVHMRGYPWWPAVISTSPANPNQGQWQVGVGKKTKYHCTFLAWNRERSWLDRSAYKKFKREDGGEGRKKEYNVKAKDYKDNHLEAIGLALQILDDPKNPMNYLEKKVEVLIAGERFTEDEEHSIHEDEVDQDKAVTPSKTSKAPIKKARQAGASKTKVKKTDDEKVKMERSLSTKTKSAVAGFFQTIAEKVKNPRTRKPVEKFSSVEENVGKIGKIKKFHQKPLMCTFMAATRPCQCAGCLLADCGQCRFCQDRVCFGGEGKLGDQRCSRKVCMAKCMEEVVIDEKMEVEEGVDIMKVANKGKRAKIVDAESENETDDEEAPLVINLDAASPMEVNINTEAPNPCQEDRSSPTYGELPTSSSISYKKSSPAENTIGHTASVWDDVKDSLLDVEDSLTRDLHVGDSFDDELKISLHPSPTTPSCSPPPSEHSASSSSIILSTPDRELFKDLDAEAEEVLVNVDEKMDENSNTDEALYFHVDDLDEIIEANVTDIFLKESDDAQLVKEVKIKDVKKVKSPSFKLLEPVKLKKKEMEKETKVALSRNKSKSKSDPETHKGKVVDDKFKENPKKVTEIDMFTNPSVKKTKVDAPVERKEEPVAVENIKPPAAVSEKKENKVVVPSRKKKSVKSEKPCVEQISSKFEKSSKEQIKHPITGESNEVSQAKSTIKSKVKEVSIRKESKPKSIEKKVGYDAKKSKDDSKTKKAKEKPVDYDDKSVKDHGKTKRVKELKKKCGDAPRDFEVKVPDASKLSLGSFKIPKAKLKPKEDKNNDTDKSTSGKEVKKKEENGEERKDHSKRSRKELKEDVRKCVVGVDRSRDEKNDVTRGSRNRIGSEEDKEIGGKHRKKEKPSEKPLASKSEKAALNWVDAVEWSDQVAPDSTTADDELVKKFEVKKILYADDVSDCSSESRDRDDCSWKRKKVKRVDDDDELGSCKKVKLWMADQKFANAPSSCCDPVESSSSSHHLPPYTMSLKVLDKLGPKSLFDSHCHLDFIMFWRAPHMELESFDQFVHAYPLMGHTSLEGFITNFCSPKLWMEHLVSPSPLIHSLLSRPSVFYTIGCHPHFARELLISRNYKQLELLIEKAGSSCVAIGECGLDNDTKNNVKMADQVEVFKLQLKLAIRMQKPLVLHIKGAEEEAIRAMEQVGLPHDWPIHRHCWNDSWSVCQAWLDRYPNSVVGITPLVTFPRTVELQKVAKLLPLSRMVLETDAPYFLPRGGSASGYLGHTTREFSLPVHVANVAAQVAAIRDCRVEEVLRATRENIARVYNI